MTDLASSALEIRGRAYAPYSGYPVGAALLGSDGKTYLGCNVENVSYGLSICAERSAVFQMVAAGCREFTEIAIATLDGGAPCGACLQVLLEFSANPEQIGVYRVDESGVCVRQTLRELIPFGFRSTNVSRTER